MAGTVNGEEEHTDTEQADMWTRVMWEGEMQVTSGGATPRPRRNPERKRHPPLKLSFESQVRVIESDEQKIERGSKLWKRAKARRAAGDI